MDEKQLNEQKNKTIEFIFKKLSLTEILFIFGILFCVFSLTNFALFFGIILIGASIVISLHDKRSAEANKVNSVKESRVDVR